MNQHSLNQKVNRQPHQKKIRDYFAIDLSTKKKNFATATFVEQCGETT